MITDKAGTIIEMADPKDAGEGIEMFSGLLTPGFSNVHCHLELSHLKGIIPPKTGLVDFVQQVMSKRGASFELTMDAMEKAASEMYQTGIVAVGDICNTADSIPVKQKSKLLWHNFIEVSGFTDAVATNRLHDMQAVFDQFLKTRLAPKTTFSPHAPYSVSKKLFQLLNDETAGQLITIHNQECADENNLYKNRTGEFLTLFKNFGIDISSFEHTGTSSFQSWLPYFNKGQSVISVHNTFAGEEDVEFSRSYLSKTGKEIFYCLCVNANKYIEQKIPPIGLLLKNNSNLVIGTDSLASNSRLNILEEIKSIQQETNYSISLEQLLQWATINGSRALQLDDITGSFEKGKTPGIVLIEKLHHLQTTQWSVARRIL